MPPKGNADVQGLTVEIRNLISTLTTGLAEKSGGAAGSGKAEADKIKGIAADIAKSWSSAGKFLVGNVSKESTEIAKAFVDAKNKASKAGANIEKAGSDLVAGLAATEKKLKEVGGSDMSSALKGIIGAISSFKGIAEKAGMLTDIVSFVIDVFTNPFKAIAKAVMAVAGMALDIVTMANKKVGSAFGGVDAVLTGLKDDIEGAFKAVGMEKMGSMLGSILDNAIKGLMFDFEDSLARRKMGYVEEAQVGAGGKRGGIGGEAAGYFDAIGRDQAQGWQKAIVSVGVTQRGVMGEMLGTGMTMGMDAGKTAATLDKTLISVRGAKDASIQMRDNFRMMQAAAAGTNVPVQMLAEAVTDSAANARFLNVDLQTVGKTMQMLMSDQDKFEAAGLSMRVDGKTILNDMATAGDKATDAMHAFYGTKGGTEGSPIEGLIKSKFGTGFASSLRSTGGGGFTATADKSGTMMIQRLDVMKTTMMEASKGAKTDAEKLYIQMKVAQDTFGMGEETARAMGMMSKEKLDVLAKDPKFADQFKTTNQLLGDMKSIATINESLARHAAGLSLQQVALAVKMLKYAEMQVIGLLASESSDTYKKAKAEAEGIDFNETFNLMKGNFTGIIGDLKDTFGGSKQATKIISDLQSMLKVFDTNEEKAARQAAGEAASAAGQDPLMDQGGIMLAGKSRYRMGAGVGAEMIIPSGSLAVPLSKFAETFKSSSAPQYTVNLGGMNITTNTRRELAEQIANYVSDAVYT